MKANVAIIILNWNGWRDTTACLESLRHLDHPSFCAIVIDNASGDDSRQRLRDWGANQAGAAPRFAAGPSLRPVDLPAPGTNGRALEHRQLVFIDSDRNGGFAAGNNLGLRLALGAGCTHMWLLNNDTVVDPRALDAMQRRMDGSAGIGMVGSVLRYLDAPEEIQAVGGVRFSFWRARGEQIGQGMRADDPEVRRLAQLAPSYVAGASMLVSAQFVREVGLMEEGYFLYCEEIDWRQRAGTRWGTATAYDSIVFHREGGTIGTSSRHRRSKVSQYYLTRNHVRFYARWRPALLPIAMLRTSKDLAHLAWRREWSLLAISLHALGAAFSGETGMTKRQL